MLKRNFGKRSGFQVPRASIGAMRLPHNEDEAVALIRHAIDSGMNYIDTCRCYGDSEIKVGKALKDGYREKVILSTKWSPWIRKMEDTDDTSADCMRKRIEDSMQRLEVDYLDFYQVWNIMNRECFEQATATGGMVDGIKKAMADGLVGHTGFTTHDSVENLLSYMDQIDWAEIILFTYNMLGTSYAPAIQAAHERGIGTVVMNPMGGGRLGEPSPILRDTAREVGCDSAPEMALRYVMANPAIDTTIVGINKLSDVNDAVAAANSAPLSAEQVARVDEFVKSRSRENVKFCTECKYCLPCPQGIDIPAMMGLIYHDRFWGFTESARAHYGHIKGPKAEACIACGDCETRCTQKLPITEEMQYCLRRSVAKGSGA